jgi:hypothetical protein
MGLFREGRVSKTDMGEVSMMSSVIMQAKKTMIDTGPPPRTGVAVQLLGERPQARVVSSLRGRHGPGGIESRGRRRAAEQLVRCG